MIAYHSFASTHPWLTAFIIWLASNVLIVCFIATRAVKRSFREKHSGAEALRRRSSH
jgi:hypothetical protein